MMKFVILSIILFVGGLTAKEICLDTESSLSEKSDECLRIGRNLSQNDLDTLTIICKLSRGIFPFQPRKSMSRNQKNSWNRYSDGLPYFQLLKNKYILHSDVNFHDCDEGIKAQADYMFWVPKSDDYSLNYRIMAREFSVNDTDRNNTSIGVLRKLGNDIKFTPIHRSDYQSQPVEPLGFDFLVLRTPIKQIFNVTNVESSVETIMEDKKYLSYFSYYNPSEYEQVVEVFLDSRYSVTYKFEEVKSFDFARIEINDEENHIEIFGFDEVKSLSKKVAYNISIPAYSSITARIVGRLVNVDSNILATKRDLFTEFESDEPVSEMTGTKKEYYVTDFHLEDVQLHHTSEVLVINYTTIYVALLCLGVVLLAGLLVFVVRLAIRRFRTPAAVPYQSVPADS